MRTSRLPAPRVGTTGDPVVAAETPMSMSTMAEWAGRLLGERPNGAFGPAETKGLPEPVRRYFAAAVAEGTPLAAAARLRMHGHIRVHWWLPFRARQIVAPHRGFVWSARAAGVIAGSDRYLDGVGSMDWRIARLLTVARAAGPDVSRSAAGRCGVEAMLVPTALLPRFGVHWRATDDEHINARFALGTTPIEVDLTLDPSGLVRSVVTPRWGDPDATGTWGWLRFGGDITAHRTFGGLTVPSAGRLGWHVGTDRWVDGEFFRFEITAFEAL